MNGLHRSNAPLVVARLRLMLTYVLGVLHLKSYPIVSSE